MVKEFYVVKFGDKYFKEISSYPQSIMLILVEDLDRARKYNDLNREVIQNLQALGGSIVEVNISEYDRTYSYKRDLEEKELDK